MNSHSEQSAVNVIKVIKMVNGWVWVSFIIFCHILHMAQRIPLPLTVSCFSKIQIGFSFLVPAHPGSPGQRAVKRVCLQRKTKY